MLKKFIYATCLSLLLGFSSRSQTLTVATYNLRGDDPKDVGNEWSKRKFMVIDQFKKYRLDLIGLQETNADMVSYLKTSIPQLDSIGEFKKIGTGIVYNSAKLSLLAHGNIYLSETPDRESKGWDAKFRRICVWGRFRDLRTKQEYFVFNSHFDHVGVLARTMSVKLLMDRAQVIAGNSPQIFMGDLNTTQFDPNYLSINNSGVFKDCYNLAINNQEKLRGTGNGFNINRRQRIRVDHIFLTEQLQALRYDVLTGLYDGHTASDHYAVISEIALKKNDLGDLYRNFPEDFENVTTPIERYGNLKIKARTGEWWIKSAILGGSLGNDRPTSGNRAVRMISNRSESAFLQMNFDVNDGASKVTVQHGVYATDSASKWQLEYSTNQGTSWTPMGPVVVSHQGDKQMATFILDVKGKVRFRINKLPGESNNCRLSIDDITIYKRRQSGPEISHQPLLGWHLPKDSGDEDVFRSTYVANGLKPTELKRGFGLIPAQQGHFPNYLTTGFTAVTAAPVADTAAAISAEDFIEFTIEPTNGADVSLTALDLQVMTKLTQKKEWYWKYSLNGSELKPLAKIFEFSDPLPASQTTVDLSLQPDLQHLHQGQKVIIRLYIARLTGEEDIISIGGAHRSGISEQTSERDYSLVVSGAVRKK